MKKIEKWFLTKLKEDKKIKSYIPKTIEYNLKDDSWIGGYAHYNFFSVDIHLRKKYKETDFGILAHELTHARQYSRLLWLHLLLIYFSDKYVLFIELDAYREQIKYYNYTNKSQYLWIVNALINPNKYGLKISATEAIEYADFMFEDLLDSNKKGK